MNLDALTEGLQSTLDSQTHINWVGTAITVVITLAITFAVSWLVTRLFRKILHLQHNPLPSSTIFINIARVSVWIIGISVILTSCFHVNLTSMITALGIGGIAISLGFQATLSNLIGGLQISLTGLVEPGDHIKVSDAEGVVEDVTWRHTRIITHEGNQVIIPNSVINTASLTKLPPQNIIRIHITVPVEDDGKTLNETTKLIEEEVRSSVQGVTFLEDDPDITYFGHYKQGYKGIITFAVGEGQKISTIRKQAIDAISKHAIVSKASKDDDTLLQKLTIQHNKIEKARKNHAKSTLNKIRTKRKSKTQGAKETTTKATISKSASAKRTTANSTTTKTTPKKDASKSKQDRTSKNKEGQQKESK